MHWCVQGCVERFSQKTDLMRNRSFIHCVSGTAGNGITSMRQHGQSRSQSTHEHKQTLSARLSVRLGFSRRLCLSLILHTLVPDLSALSLIYRCSEWIVLDYMVEIKMIHNSPLYTVHSEIIHLIFSHMLQPYIIKCIQLFCFSHHSTLHTP